MKIEEYMPDKPEHVKISITNICNYRCVMCPNFTFKQLRGYMKDELAYQIIDDCVVSGIAKLSLGSSGEATLHKGFLKYLKYAKGKGLWVSTATNCSQLTPEFTDELLTIGIDRINLSVYSSTPEEHRNYCKNNNFEKVVKNITYFLERWNATGKKTDVKMGFLSLPGVNDEAAFMALWEPITQQYGLEIDRKVAINWAGSVDTIDESVFQRKWRVRRKGAGFVLQHCRAVPCTQMPSYIYILHDGTVHPCCNFMDSTDHPEMRFGNVTDSSIIEAWQAPRFQKFREKHYQCDVHAFRPCVSCEARFQISEITVGAVLRRVLMPWK